MTAPRAIVWLAALPWDPHNFARPQQIPRALAGQGWDVTYVAVRPSWVRRLRRGGTERAAWRAREVAAAPGRLRILYLAAPLPGAHRLRWARRANERALRWQARARLGPAAAAGPWIANAPLLYRPWPAGAPVVYDCSDDVRLFRWCTPAYVRVEEELLRGAAAVVFSSATLEARYGGRCRQSAVVRNACDAAHFARAAGPGALPADLAAVPEPRVGFHGLIGAWLDLPLVAAAAAALPEVSWVFLGRVEITPTLLPRLPNLHFLGARPYAALPDYVRGMSVMVLPFARGALTEAVDPVKLYEYLAAGRPVVATPLPALAEPAAAGLIRLTAGAPDWAEAVRAALGERAPELAARRQAYARAQSWSARAAQYAEVLARAGG